MKKSFISLGALFWIFASTFAAHAYLFQDNFDDGNLDGWTQIPDSYGNDHGGWSVVDVGGNSVLKSDADPSHLGFLLADGVVMPQSFVLEFDAIPINYNAAYMHFYDHDTHLIGGVRAPRELFLIEEINANRNKMRFYFSIGNEYTWHHHRYVKEGDWVSFYFDHVLMYRQELPQPISGGGLALLASRGAHFDNILLTSNPIPEPATMILLGSGLVGFAIPRIRKKFGRS